MSPVPTVSYAVIDCNRIIPSRKNPRTPSPDDEAFIAELSESLKESGMPTIDVESFEPEAGEQLRTDSPSHEILCGETRWRAWLRAGGTQIGCLVRGGLTPSQKTALQVTENVKRRGLPLRDQFFAVTRLYKELEAEPAAKGEEGMTIQQRAAARLKMDLAWVSLRANIAALRPEVQQLMLDHIVTDPETLHLLDKVADLDPEIYESEMRDIQDPECLEPVTRDSLRNLVRELKERAKRLAGGEQEKKPEAPKTDQLPLTAPEEELPDNLPAALAGLHEDGRITVETVKLLLRVRELNREHFDAQVSLLRRQVRIDGAQYREGLDALILNLEHAALRQPSAPAEPTRAAATPTAAETAEAKRKRAAQRIVGEVADFTRDMNQRLAKTFALSYDPAQIFANALSVSCITPLHEHAVSLPETPQEAKFTIRFAGTLAELEPALGALMPIDKVRLNSTLECTPAELRKVEKALGRPLQFEYRGEGSGKLIQQSLRAYEKGNKAAAPKGKQSDAPEEGADSIRMFLKACTQAKSGVRVESAELIKAYKAYCQRHKVRPVDAISMLWATEIERAKLGRVKSNGKRYYTGVQLLVDGE